MNKIYRIYYTDSEEDIHIGYASDEDKVRDFVDEYNGKIIKTEDPANIFYGQECFFTYEEVTPDDYDEMGERMLMLIENWNDEITLEKELMRQ